MRVLASAEYFNIFPVKTPQIGVWSLADEKAKTVRTLEYRQRRSILLQQVTSWSTWIIAWSIVDVRQRSSVIMNSADWNEVVGGEVRRTQCWMICGWMMCSAHWNTCIGGYHRWYCSRKDMYAFRGFEYLYRRIQNMKYVLLVKASLSGGYRKVACHVPRIWTSVLADTTRIETSLSADVES